jgi:hypothetical protein
MKRWLVLSIGLLFASVLSSAQTQLPWWVFGNGGSLRAIGNQRVLSATIGQVIIGRPALTDGKTLYQGFWLPLLPTVSVEEEGSDPNAGGISNYPNPFSQSTTIRFDAPIEGMVMVRVYDLVGNLVRTIGVELSVAGEQLVEFDGLSDSGAPLATGTYIYEVTGTSASGNQFRRIQRMSILR